MLLTQHGAIGHCIIMKCFKNFAKEMQNFRSVPRCINSPDVDAIINSQYRKLTVDLSSLTVSIKVLDVNSNQATQDPSMLKGYAALEDKLSLLNIGM